MIKHLRKVGNSNALILDRAVMELVGLEENGEVQLTVSNGSLIITPATPKTIDPKRLEKILDQLVIKRRHLLKQLADED